MKLRTAIHLVLGAAALSGSAHAVAQEAESMMVLEEIIVTAQKREENVQDVPIAVTALTAEALASQRIDNGADLQRAVPNMNFSRIAGGETNYQIRGIGYQLVATAGDAGVGLHSNNIPLSVSRIADADFYDIERIEVLRGPQGTLYGRNATGGVINVITAKPTTSEFSGKVGLEYGDYETKKVNGYVNLPMGDMFAMRIAGSYLERDGYTKNTWTGDSMDGRDLWSARVSLLFNPSDAFKATLRFERFEEDDDRTNGAKDLCIKDPGPTSVGGVATDGGGNAARVTQDLLSRGCLQGSVYSPEAFGTVNYTAALAGQLGLLSGLLNGDVYSGVTQSTNLREVSVAPIPNHKTPLYQVTNDLYELNLEFNVTDSLKLTSLTGYVEDTLLSMGAGAAYTSNATFNAIPGLTPGGEYNDPQIGASSRPQVLTIQDNESEQLSTELRLQSSFDGALNFNVGGIYLNLKKTNDLFIIPNTQNAYVQLINSVNDVSTQTTCDNPNGVDCYFDTSAFPDGTGHNYFVSHVPYELTATALFGELYWDISDSFRLTTGLRYTDDKKEILLHPSNMLQSGRGYTPNVPVQQEADWQEVTGRANLEWRVTDNNLMYFSYSKGYKGGGINNPDATDTSPAYDPEFVNAYEIGSKNTLFGGSLMLNVTGFMYDYEGYQISQLRGLISATENIDAEITGAELEVLWEPINNLRLNAVAGWLDTEIKAGSSVDTFDRIQGQQGVTLVKATTDTCLAATSQLASLISAVNAGTLPRRVLLAVCDSPTAQGLFRTGNPANPTGGLIVVDPLPSNPVNLAGKQLPQAPELTASAGAQYTFGIGGSWEMTIRGDYYYQADAFTRVYNSVSDELRAWDNYNASLIVENKDLGFSVQAYGKNLADEDVITGYSTNSDQLGLTRGALLLDPRLVGVVVTKTF
jgi:outer membrane receptor protein involved in Fe transport